MIKKSLSTSLALATITIPGQPPGVLRRRMVLLILFLLLSGCQSIPPTPIVNAPGSQDQPLPSGRGWWNARFGIAWPKDQEPSWYMGTLIADQVISPVLKAHRSSIELWRFHRRAARDKAGHIFSFIFYATPQDARRIYRAIELSPVLKQLRDRRAVVRVSFDDTSTIGRPAIKDASDAHWPEVIQQSWPPYIMGASQMWLELIHALAADEERDQSQIAGYKSVQNKLNQLWLDEGQHALLHHLNALFGYQPVKVIERNLMHF